MQLTGTNPGLAPFAARHGTGRQDGGSPPGAPNADKPSATILEKADIPANSWRAKVEAVDPATHVAPPSIMQLKILALLEDQKVAQPDPDAEAPQGISEPDGEVKPDKADTPADAIPKADAYDPIEALKRGSAFADPDRPEPETDVMTGG